VLPFAVDAIRPPQGTAPYGLRMHRPDLPGKPVVLTEVRELLAPVYGQDSEASGNEPEHFSPLAVEEAITGGCKRTEIGSSGSAARCGILRS
jgi:hypothetical protein